MSTIPSVGPNILLPRADLYKRVIVQFHESEAQGWHNVTGSAINAIVKDAIIAAIFL